MTKKTTSKVFENSTNTDGAVRVNLDMLNNILNEISPASESRMARREAQVSDEVDQYQLNFHIFETEFGHNFETGQSLPQRTNRDVQAILNTTDGREIATFTKKIPELCKLGHRGLCKEIGIKEAAARVLIHEEGKCIGHICGDRIFAYKKSPDLFTGLAFIAMTDLGMDEKQIDFNALKNAVEQHLEETKGKKPDQDALSSFLAKHCDKFSRHGDGYCLPQFTLWETYCKEHGLKEPAPFRNFCC